jgi:hypothetical protein
VASTIGLVASSVMCRAGCGLRVSGEGGDGGVELAPAHGGEQVSGVILARTDRDGWAGAAELSEGALGPRRSAWAEGTAVRGAPPLRQEVVRPQRMIRKRTIRRGGYPLPPTLTL